MPVSYSGYAARREGDRGTLDVGEAFGGAIAKIEAAKAAEEKRREALTDIFDKNKRQIDSYAEGKDPGFNDWMQGTITEVKEEIGNKFKLLKQGKSTDNEYRRWMSNLISGWSMLAKRAQGWNTHYEEGLKQVTSGEGSPYMNFMLGKSSKIAKFANLKMFIQDDGTPTLWGVDANGVLVPGSETALTSIMSPENSFDAAIDAPKALAAMVGTLPKYSTTLKDGKKIIDLKNSPHFNSQRLLNTEAAISASPRDAAKWYSALNENKVNYFTNPNERFSMIDEYMQSDIGINAVENRAQELMAADPSIVDAAAAKDKATMEIEGEQHMLQLLSASEGNYIDQPQFKTIFKIPSAADGGRPITILQEKINATTGEVESPPKTFQPGDEVPIGEMQYNKVKAQIYDKQVLYAGHEEGGGKRGETDEGKRKRLLAAKILDTQVNYYETGRDMSRGIGLEKLKTSGRVKDIKLIPLYRPSPQDEEGPYMVIWPIKGKKIELPYETDGKGNITEEGYEKMNESLQGYIQKTDDTGKQELNFDIGKAESNKRGQEYDPAQGVTSKREKFVDLATTKFSGIGKTDDEFGNYNRTLKEILTDERRVDERPAVDILSEFLQMLASPSDRLDMSKIQITEDYPRVYGADMIVIKVGDEEFKIETSSDENISQRRGELRKTITKIFNAYHSDLSSKTKKLMTLKEWKAAGKPDGNYTAYRANN